MSKILDQQLKAVVIHGPGLGEESEGFVALPLQQVPVGDIVPFDVFLKVRTNNQEARFVKACIAGQAFEEEWYVKLNSLKISWIYYQVGDEGRVLKYLVEQTDKILLDEKRHNQEKINQLHDVSQIWLQHIFRSGVAPDSNQLRVAQHLTSSFYEYLKHDPAPLHYLLDMRRHVYNLYTHTLGVLVLGMAFLAHLGWSSRDAQHFGVGVLVHDIGMTKIPQEIINQKEPLTKDQRNQIKRHPLEGFRLLKDQPHLRKEALLMVMQHHENCDGSGYPSGLKEPHIHPWAQILRILDSYEALTAARPWRGPETPSEALWTMSKDCQKKQIYKKQYLKAFIKFLAAQ